MRALILTATLLVAGCPKGDEACGDACDTDVGDTTCTDGCDTDVAAWEPVAEHLGGALLSVTGTTSDDVWAIGAQDDAGPLVLHFDGDAWTRLNVPEGGDLWWGWRPPGTDGTLFAVGANGRALRYAGGTWEGGLIAEGADVLTLFGVWGASADDAWAVGGNISASSHAAAMFHWDGDAWTPVTLPPGAAAVGSLYKVWGSSADDVWACGNGGTLLHYDGSTWTDEAEDLTDSTLLTLTGTGPDAAWAVGGNGTGTILHWDGLAWADESPDFAPEFNGVFARGADVVAVGSTGQVWRRTGGVWAVDPLGRAGVRDLHGAWLDPDGGTWVVGGQIAAMPLIEGVLYHTGPSAVPAYVP